MCAHTYPCSEPTSNGRGQLSSVKVLQRSVETTRTTEGVRPLSGGSEDRLRCYVDEGVTKGMGKIQRTSEVVNPGPPLRTSRAQWTDGRHGDRAGSLPGQPCRLSTTELQSMSPRPKGLCRDIRRLQEARTLHFTSNPVLHESPEHRKKGRNCVAEPSCSVSV